MFSFSTGGYGGGDGGGGCVNALQKREIKEAIVFSIESHLDATGGEEWYAVGGGEKRERVEGDNRRWWIGGEDRKVNWVLLLLLMIST